MNRFLTLVGFILILSCCKEDSINGIITDQNGQISYLPSLWSLPLHDDGDWRSHSQSVVGNNIIDHDKVLIITNENSKSRFLTLADGNSGEILWKWNDWYQPETERFYGRFTVQKSNHLHWINGTRHYWVDLENGQTVKKYRGESSFIREMRSLNDHFFVIGQPLDTLTEYSTLVAFHGDFYDEDLTMVPCPEFNLDHAIGNRIGEVTSVYPYVENQDTFLITAYQEIFPNWNFQSYLGLYNLTKNIWVYDSIPLCEISQKGVLYQPLKKHENTIITNVATKLVCYNYFDGSLVWERDFPHDFSFSGFEIENGILVANCENETLYGLNASTGDILWTGEGAGTSSKLENRILNGVVYFGGGSSGHFHAVDIYTGKTLWKLDPYLYEPTKAFWTWSVNVLPGIDGKKGKVIVQNALNAYCLEAAN